MRSTVLLATAIVILSFSAVGAGAMSLYQPGSAPAPAELRQATAMVATTGEERPTKAAPGGAEAGMTANYWDARTLRREIGPTLRTAFLLGFAGVVIGLGAVGVKSLWVVEEAEYAALSQDSREGSLPGSDRMLTCLGDYPA